MTANMTKSKTELTGPIYNINRETPLASHVFGFSRNSLSTLSHGMAIWDISYNRFWMRRCIGNIGRNGKNALAPNKLNILPKLLLVVIFIYLMMFPNVRLP